MKSNYNVIIMQVWMGRECSTHGREEEITYDFGGKTVMKETTNKI
jgi:hypothetical protein